MLNFLSGGVLVFVALFLVVAGAGLTYLVRRGRSKPAAAAAVVADTSGPGTLCSGSPVAYAFPAAAVVAQVALGEKQLPSDPAALTRIGAIRKPRSDGGFVDTFTPPGGSIAALYGPAGQMRAVAVRFATPQPLCDALVLTGIVTPASPASIIVDSTGRVSAESSTLGFFSRDVVVRLRQDNAGRVELIQAERSGS